MRMLGLSFLVVTGALAACAGPADPSAPATPGVDRTGSLVKLPDGPQPTLTYLTPDQFSRTPGQSVGAAFAHSVPTPVPPTPEAEPETPAQQ